ncbi:polysaccharide pyruvyl transferase family protein [Draconibacterium sp.]|nr:polysaccharide pyruvyl transferase family protein [Draconibacterium sp.]
MIDVTNSVKVLFYNGSANFGDELNKTILPMYLGTDICHAPEKQADLVAIGSLLELLLHKGGHFSLRFARQFMKPISIWGTGFIAPADTRIVRPGGLAEATTREPKIFALRGELSLERMRTMTGRKLSSVALGDPGLLCGKVNSFEPNKKTRRMQIGVIPHYVDKDTTQLAALMTKLERAKLIDIQGSAKDVIEQVSKCDLILSSAMHGLIAADALGIANIRVIFTDGLVGGDYKFNDYYSALGVYQHRRLDLRVNQLRSSDLEVAREGYSLSCDTIEKVCANLIAKADEMRRFICD